MKYKLLKKAFLDIYCGRIKIKLTPKEKRLAKKLEIELTKVMRGGGWFSVSQPKNELKKCLLSTNEKGEEIIKNNSSIIDRFDKKTFNTENDVIDWIATNTNTYKEYIDKFMTPLKIYDESNSGFNNLSRLQDSITLINTIHTTTDRYKIRNIIPGLHYKNIYVNEYNKIDIQTIKVYFKRMMGFFLKEIKNPRFHIIIPEDKELLNEKQEIIQKCIKIRYNKVNDEIEKDAYISSIKEYIQKNKDCLSEEIKEDDYYNNLDNLINYL
jgi:hypothetical protein